MDPSTLILVALLTYAVWNSFGPLAPTGQALSLAALAAFLFVLAILVHELAHAVVARARGIEVKGVTLLMWGGYTETDGAWEKPSDEFLVSVVGPLSSLAIGFVLLFVVSSGLVGHPGFEHVLRYVGGVNVTLGVFNLLPGFPLDGGRVLRSVLWKVMRDENKATRIAAFVGQVFGVALIALGIWELARPVGNSPFGLWPMLIGWMMFSTAAEVRRNAGVRRLLADGTAGEAMGPPPPSIPESISLSEALDRFLMGHEQDTFPVVDAQGGIAGLLTFTAARRVGQQDPLRPVRDAMLPVIAGAVAKPDDTLDRVEQRLGTRRSALVLEGTAVVGQVSRADMDRWLRTRAQRA
jgi:Zn-dependent protease